MNNLKLRRLLHLLAVVVRMSNVKASTWELMQAEAGRHGYRLVDTAGAARLHEQGALFVDLRDCRLLADGRIPGAVSFPMPPTLWQRLSRVAGLRRLLGPDANQTVVFY